MSSPNFTEIVTLNIKIDGEYPLTYKIESTLKYKIYIQNDTQKNETIVQSKFL